MSIQFCIIEVVFCAVNFHIYQTNIDLTFTVLHLHATLQLHLRC